MTQQTHAAENVAHATFSVERTYPEPPARVFKAFTDKTAKLRWYVGGEGWEVFAYELDFRVGGVESSRFAWKGGPEVTNDTVFQDIVPERRIISAYRMTVAGKPISASLSTMELFPEGGGTRLVYTEQGAYLGDPGAAKSREEGCRGLFEILAKELATH